VNGQTSVARLTGVGRIDRNNLHTRPQSLVLNEPPQPVERPTVQHSPLVIADGQPKPLTPINGGE
ncbi:MAG: hypothetical protein Q6M54_03960, partial [Thermostichus sp. DRC_bins_24]